MDLRKSALSSMISSAMKGQLILLYFLKKTEDEVKSDVNRAIKNITCWLEAVFDPKKNAYGIKYEQFIAAEQEFNTNMYGIKGNIDSTIVLRDPEGNVRETALEIKTGKYKSTAYRGQVLLYSLLISERFMKSANPENILLFIMDEDVKNTQSF
jgi:hypothetical protein